MTYALVGNQNSGKTTLFNQLTGSNQHVGNFPGVTVAKKTGAVRGKKDSTVVDLPGIYSLRPYSAEEIVTRDFILKDKPDAIINIVDATNLERNLYLTLQLIDLQVPMVVALNMMDEVRASGGSVDTRLLSERLGVPVLPISAVRNEGIDDLIDIVERTAVARRTPSVYDFCSPGPIHRCIHAVSHVVEDHAERALMPSRYAAMNVIENNADLVERLALDENELELAEHAIVEMERECHLDRYAAIAAMRYDFIEEVCAGAVVRQGESRERARSRKMDDVLTHRIFAIPIFLGVMLLVFYLTFDVIGAFLSDALAYGIDGLIGLIDRGLTAYGINPVVHSLLIDGVCTGIGNVLSFLPLIVTLFFFLSMLEDTGYMARIAFVMDKPLRRIGLSGKSIVPMLIGFGCSVPAIMATRTLTSERDRRMTVMLTPFMSCSAKIPIYTTFIAAFFPSHRALVMLLLYGFGVLCSILFALIAKKTAFRGNPIPFVMELPNYRLPSMKTTLLLMWDKAADFLKRAFTIIFAATVLIWFLQAFDVRLNTVTDPANSILASLGRIIAPLFAPLGLNDWWAITSLISGLAAKEAVISTLTVLLGTTDLSGAFTIPTAISFLTFTLLYTPCFAAIAAIKREMRSGLKTVGIVLMQCAIAWICGAVVYQLIGLFF
ncbi:MAG: ferrous iron transport protein B [Ruminococcaceae bacterium]|nr:ferrous iron transport protein B [Oscillospiraceae bacterium]